MAKSKYTPERVRTILDAVAATGGDRAGYEAGGISCETFYDWIKKYPEFSEGISKAKQEFQDICPKTLVRQANKAFADYLYGRVKVKVTKKKYLGETVIEKEVRIVRPSPPRWAIERVLGKPLDVLEAIKTLAAAGILPAHLVQVAIDELREARKGITEAFTGVLPENDLRRIRPGLSQETAATVRAHLLGILPADAPSLPGEVDSGQQPDQGDGEVQADRD